MNLNDNIGFGTGPAFNLVQPVLRRKGSTLGTEKEDPPDVFIAESNSSAYFIKQPIGISETSCFPLPSRDRYRSVSDISPGIRIFACTSQNLENGITYVLNFFKGLHPRRRSFPSASSLKENIHFAPFASLLPFISGVFPFPVSVIFSAIFSATACTAERGNRNSQTVCTPAHPAGYYKTVGKTLRSCPSPGVILLTYRLLTLLCWSRA